MVNICDGKVLVFMACALFCNASANSRSRDSNGSTHPLNVVLGRSEDYHWPLARNDIGDNDDDNGFSLFRLLGRNVVNKVKKAVSILRPKIRDAISHIEASEESRTEINGKSDKIDSKILRKEEMTSTGEPAIADYFGYQEDPEELEEELGIVTYPFDEEELYYPDDSEETEDQQLENQEKYLDTERELDPPTLTQHLPSIKNAPDAIDEYGDPTIIKTLGKDLDTDANYQPGSKSSIVMDLRSTTKKQITHRIEPVTTESTPVPSTFTDIFTSLKEEVETDDPGDTVDRSDQMFPGQPRANWIFSQETTTEAPGYIQAIAMGVYDHAISPFRSLWNTMGK